MNTANKIIYQGERPLPENIKQKGLPTLFFIVLLIFSLLLSVSSLTASIFLASRIDYYFLPF